MDLLSPIPAVFILLSILFNSGVVCFLPLYVVEWGQIPNTLVFLKALHDLAPSFMTFLSNSALQTCWISLFLWIHNFPWAFELTVSLIWNCLANSHFCFGSQFEHHFLWEICCDSQGTGMCSPTASWLSVTTSTAFYCYYFSSDVSPASPWVLWEQRLWLPCPLFSTKSLCR